MNHHVSIETRTILLLCSGLGRPRTDEPRPLGPTEYGRLRFWLAVGGLQLTQLARGEPGLLRGAGHGLDAERLQARLDRKTALQRHLAWLAGNNLWVLGREDAGYPVRLSERLGAAAPPLLHGCGSRMLLEAGGLAVAGARAASEAGLAFARLAGKCCAQEGFTVVSGAARGVDRAVMVAALEAGGTAVGVLPGSLLRIASEARWQEGLAAGRQEARLSLVTPFEPDAAFSTGTAMGRNRFIYLLGDWALVVEAGAGRGGTWNGAAEALKHGRVPVFVRLEDAKHGGSRLLVERGAIPLDSGDLAYSGLAGLSQLAEGGRGGQMGLF